MAINRCEKCHDPISIKVTRCKECEGKRGQLITMPAHNTPNFPRLGRKAQILPWRTRCGLTY